MTEYDNNLRGALFKNDDKESDKHPDYKGSCEIDGRQYWLSAWIKTSKAGKKYMSLSFKARDQKPAEKTQQQQRRETVSRDFDDDISF
jgi:uncharacterized protein (DUF736 family)